MATPDYRSLAPPSPDAAAAEPQKRSALGIGVTTLVTILVVLLLATFSVLSLVLARSNLELSQRAATQAQSYYAADSEATVWYAALDTFAATMEGAPTDFAEQLKEAGYEPQTSDAGELVLTQGFAINDQRTLMVTIAVNSDKTTTIRQWQS
ncbi:MAG: hypothetical protein LBJ48_08080 [Coriobacteriales bacterium]|jgi:hypothetical protein|nr:hypothetical protein [Coriobacteriales bacterium]